MTNDEYIETFIGFEPMSWDDDPLRLVAFSLATKAYPNYFARLLFPDLPPGYRKTTKDLGDYAKHMATAIWACKNGMSTTCSAHMDICDHIYERLPEYALIYLT